VKVVVVPERERSMTRARIALVLVALATGIGVASVVAHESRQDVLDAALGVGIGWSFVAAGLVAWARRPENAIGRVMVLAGLLRLAAEFCTGTDNRVLYPIGHLSHHAFWIAIIYVLLAFPGGRLESALSRWILVGAALLLPLQLGWLLLGAENHARDGFAVASSTQGAHAFDRAATGLGLLLVPLVIFVLSERWRRASARLRVAIAPVLWAGAAALALALLMVMDDVVGNPLGAAPAALFDLGLAGVAIAFLVGLLRARLARSAVAELVVELGRATAPGDLGAALARALRDPSLALAYWLPDGGRYIDVEGRPFELPAESEERAVSVVERDGRRIAALVHDPALGEEPELVQSVCAAAALALENERLQAELRSRLEDLQASRARIVDAADGERRRIERNLHDGAQQRLVSIAMALGLAQAKLQSDPVAADAVFGEARQGLSAALEELRELSHGIHPAILTERGLNAALEELTLRSAVPVALDVDGTERLPGQVEAAAYYVVSEALANVAKYAHATSTQVRVRPLDGKIVVDVTDDGIGGADAGRGSGLRGLTDRVEALGGRFWLSSPPGHGTVVRAEIPCG
jgi:signal transduction histidine kinase